MKLKLLLTIVSVATGSATFAQTTTKVTPLEISGSVDTYFKYDVANQPGNIKT